MYLDIRVSYQINNKCVNYRLPMVNIKPSEIQLERENLASMQDVVPDRSTAHVDVEVGVATAYAHQTVPDAVDNNVRSISDIG